MCEDPSGLRKSHTQHDVHTASYRSLITRLDFLSCACVYVCGYLLLHTAAEQITLLTVFITAMPGSCAATRLPRVHLHATHIHTRAREDESVARCIRSSGMSCVRISRTFMKSPIIIFLFLVSYYRTHARCLYTHAVSSEQFIYELVMRVSNRSV